jgi:hypothetical protein
MTWIMRSKEHAQIFVKGDPNRSIIEPSLKDDHIDDLIDVAGDGASIDPRLRPRCAASRPS